MMLPRAARWWPLYFLSVCLALHWVGVRVGGRRGGRVNVYTSPRPGPTQMPPHVYSEVTLFLNEMQKNISPLI